MSKTRNFGYVQGVIDGGRQLGGGTRRPYGPPGFRRIAESAASWSIGVYTSRWEGVEKSPNRNIAKMLDGGQL